MHSHLLQHLVLWQYADVGSVHSCFRSIKCYFRTAGIEYMREYPGRFIESDTENSWMELRIPYMKYTVYESIGGGRRLILGGGLIHQKIVRELR